MPDWLHDIIRGDAYAVLGVTLEPDEKERLSRVKARKQQKNAKREEKTMSQKEAVLNELKKGPQTIDGLSAATGINPGSLYAVCSALDNAGVIVRESIDGGRMRQYRLASHAQEAQAEPEAETPALPLSKPERALRKHRVRPGKAVAKGGEIQLYRPGEKFVLSRDGAPLCVLFTHASTFVNLLTGEEVIPTLAEMQTAHPVYNIAAEFRQTISIA